MATIYEETPTFEERVQGAAIIIVGQIEKASETKVDYSGDQPQVQTVFRVNIEHVLKGEIPKKSVSIRVIGGKAETVETDWSVRINEGDQVLLMLAPDYGPDRTEDTFVPYFSSCYTITQKATVKLDEDTAKELVSQKIQVKKATAQLEDLRLVIDAMNRRQKKEAAVLDEMEPAEFREIPYGEVTEMPQPTGEARSASPEDAPEELREAD